MNPHVSDQENPATRIYLGPELKCTANLNRARRRGEQCIQEEMTHQNVPAAHRIEPSIRYMMAHLDERISISRLSAMVGLSQSSFFEHFKTATGQSPVKLLIRARMRWAGALLVETNLQIKEIAGLVGYDDQFYFSRLFKVASGLSPRNYRAQQGFTNHRKHLLSKSQRHPAFWLTRTRVGRS